MLTYTAVAETVMSVEKNPETEATGTASMISDGQLASAARKILAS